jgi:hypothetical protein
MDRAADVQPDAAAGEVVDDVAGVPVGAGEPIELVTTRVSPARQAASAFRSPGGLGWCR